MRYAKLSCTEFCLCYLQQCHSIDLFFYRTERVILIRSIRSFVQKFSWSWLLSFLGELSMDTHVVLCMGETHFLRKMFYPRNGENRPSPGFFECIGKFSFFSQFFIFLSIQSIMKVHITVILVYLKKFHIWQNSGSLNMAQNALGQSDCRIFQLIAGL